MKVTQVLQPKSVALENLILVDSSATATINDSIGYYHNTIIYSAFEKKIISIIGKASQIMLVY